MNPSYEEYWKLQKSPYCSSDTFYSKFWSNIYLGYPSNVRMYVKGNVLQYGNNKIQKMFNAPENTWGYCYPHSGNSYLGFIPLSIGGYMEHITGLLQDTLIKDKSYKVSFYLRYAGSRVALCFSKMEMSFSCDSQIIKRDPANAPSLFLESSKYENIFKEKKIKSDLTFKVDQPCDTNNWIELTGTYIAKGGERLFTIGLFYQDNGFNEKMKNMEVAYIKCFDDKKKRKKFLRAIGKFGIPFINYNPNYNIDFYIGKNHSVDASYDSGYYFIDDISITQF